MEVKTISDGNSIWFTVSLQINGAPIAVAALNTKSQEIWCLLVDAPFRRKKIATELIERIETEAKALGMKHVFATTSCNNKPTQELFEKLRYEKWLKYYKNL